MPMGEDGSWRPGTREDQRREAAALGEDKGVRLMRWAFPVFAALSWVTFLLGWSQGDAWRADGLLLYLLIACGWSVLALGAWWTHLRAKARRT
ncbi:hypothetical protein [Serinicoccus hydrothermalis]|uniref:hypothetical protein n=1 Tax=Serinicoccus hydrothermalis TaxID=1758689 RepID=UPI0008364B2C|nr:hypothetical protein [Serinicoccus hydrothermalis]